VFSAALLLATLLSVGWLRMPRRGRALGAGFAWGIAALTRPTALPLPLVVAWWAWAPLGLMIGRREAFRQILWLGLGVAAIVAPWTVRNAVALHAFVPITTGAGGALMVANNPVAWDDRATRGGARSDTYRAAMAGEFRGLSEVEVDARARRRAWEFMRARLRDWPAVALAKLGRFWRLGAEGGGTGTWQRPGSSLEALRRLDPMFAWSVLTLPFALVGLVATARGGRTWFQSLPVLFIAYFTLLGVVFFGSLRMRMPVEPFVILFVAAGLDATWRGLRARKRGPRVVPGGGLPPRRGAS